MQTILSREIIQAHGGIRCVHCLASIELNARFCGECGVVHELTDKAMATAGTSALPAKPQVPDALPSFIRAQVKAATPRIQSEVEEVLVALARERLFLMGNVLLFLATNLLGFYLSMRCYHEFIGDDLTKLIMSGTPFLFINTFALLCISPINKTKREIYRLQQKLQSLRLQVEYHQLLKF